MREPRETKIKRAQNFGEPKALEAKRMREPKNLERQTNERYVR